MGGSVRGCAFFFRERAGGGRGNNELYSLASVMQVTNLKP